MNFRKLFHVFKRISLDRTRGGKSEWSRGDRNKRESEEAAVSKTEGLIRQGQRRLTRGSFVFPQLED